MRSQPDDPYEWQPVKLLPSEVAKIAELSPDTQREFRRRRIIEVGGAGSRGYLPLEVAQLTLLQRMRSEARLSYDIAAPRAKDAARSVLWSAMLEYAVWEYAGPPSERAEFEDFMKSLETRKGTSRSEYVKLIITDDAEWTPATFSFWAAEGWQETSDPTLVFTTTHRHVEVSVLINHFAVASTLYKRLTRPLFLVRRKANWKPTRGR